MITNKDVRDGIKACLLILHVSVSVVVSDQEATLIESVRQVLGRFEYCVRTGNAREFNSLFSEEFGIREETCKVWVAFPHGIKDYELVIGEVIVDKDRAAALGTQRSGGMVMHFAITLGSRIGDWKIESVAFNRRPFHVPAVLPPTESRFQSDGCPWGSIGTLSKHNMVCGQDVVWTVSAVCDDSYLFLRLNCSKPLAKTGTPLEAGGPLWVLDIDNYPQFIVTSREGSGPKKLGRIKLGASLRRSSTTEERIILYYMMVLDGQDGKLFSRNTSEAPYLIEFWENSISIKVPLDSFGIESGSLLQLRNGLVNSDEEIFIKYYR